MQRPPAQQRGGPPRGIDDSDVVHQIFVKVVDPAIDPDRKSKQFTLQLLTYIHERLPEFKQMGAAMKVNKIRSIDLQNPRLVEAMRRRRITNLPAVTTPYNEYVGLKAIFELYDRNIEEHAAIMGRGEKAAQGAYAEEEDLFRQFYGDEMTLEKAENDAEDTSIGDNGDDMMTRYREFAAKREQSAARRPTPRPSAQAGGAHTAAPRSAPPRPAAPQRPAEASQRPAPRAGGNVAPPQDADPDDRDFNEMLDRLSRDIDDNTRAAAFSSTGGDADLDEGSSDPRDELMLSAFYGNQVSSDTL